MPIYEIYCAACMKVHEDRRPVAERNASDKCPRCGNVAQRTLAGPGFVLKGAGWYAADFKSR